MRKFRLEFSVHYQFSPESSMLSCPSSALFSIGASDCSSCRSLRHELIEIYERRPAGTFCCCSKPISRQQISLSLCAQSRPRLKSFFDDKIARLIIAEQLIALIEHFASAVARLSLNSAQRPAETCLRKLHDASHGERREHVRAEIISFQGLRGEKKNVQQRGKHRDRRRT
jgi:hypothetical protein